MQGESYNGVGTRTFTPNGGAGGGGNLTTVSGGDVGGGGAGGSFGIIGANGQDGETTRAAEGYAGATYGSTFPSQLFLGSGGGGGVDTDGTPSGTSGAGGRGGGAVLFSSTRLNLAGNLSARGTAGGNDTTVVGDESGGGGGGSGGSIYIQTGSDVRTIAPRATGGAGGLTNSTFALNGGGGGRGRLNINGVNLLTPIDLRTGVAESFPATTGFNTPAWTVSSDGATVNAAADTHPAVFYVPQSILNSHISGTFRPGSDDDVFGLVLGFNPGDTSNASANYLLLDWKRVTQAFNFTGGNSDTSGSTTSEEGLALSRVTGIPSADELWGHANLAGTTGGLVELAEALTLGEEGYSPTGVHNFEIFYDDDRVQIYIDNVLQFDLAGTYGDGYIGYYVHSQGASSLSNLTITPLDALIDALPIPEPSSVLVWIVAAALLSVIGCWRSKRSRAS